METFWQQVGSNLHAGRLRLLFVADEIPPQLRRIVEFLNQQMEGRISIAEFINVIKRLPSHPTVHDPRVWYTTQKEHWLGWLGEYDGPGGYGRVPGKKRDAKFAYNHIVNPEMLLWLFEFFIFDLLLYPDDLGSSAWE